MNIESSKIKQTNESQVTKPQQNQNQDGSIKFSDELKEVSQKALNTQKNEDKPQQTTSIKQENDEKVPLKKECTKERFEINQNIINQKEDNQNLNNAIDNLSTIVKELNQSEENSFIDIKKEEIFDDKENMINKDFNIQENKEILPQMNPNMNFSGDGQPFSSFMNQENEKTKKNANTILGTSSQDLAEEAAILSTMAENIAMVNKNQALKDTKIISNEEGVKKVETKTGIKIETVVKYDSIIMNQADVEVFADLVEKNEANLNNLAPKAAEKAVAVSKTLADMLAKSMQNNQPLRIDFDNNISVIIRISRDGKISADFLPSSQVAEAYLRENLPLLRQKFDDNNLEYDSLNQRERRESNKEQSKKKDRNNE